PLTPASSPLPLPAALPLSVGRGDGAPPAAGLRLGPPRGLLLRRPAPLRGGRPGRGGRRGHLPALRRARPHPAHHEPDALPQRPQDRKSTRLNSSHVKTSYA